MSWCITGSGRVAAIPVNHQQCEAQRRRLAGSFRHCTDGWFAKKIFNQLLQQPPRMQVGVWHRTWLSCSDPSTYMGLYVGDSGGRMVPTCFFDCCRGNASNGQAPPGRR